MTMPSQFIPFWGDLAFLVEMINLLSVTFGDIRMALMSPAVIKVFFLRVMRNKNLPGYTPV